MNNTFTMSLLEPLSDAQILGRTYFQCELRATNSFGVQGSSSLIVDIVQPVPIVVPKFTKPLFRGSLDIILGLTLETVQLVEGTYGPDVNFTLDGGKQS